jgi:hypothetical protein
MKRAACRVIVFAVGCVLNAVFAAKLTCAVSIRKRARLVYVFYRIQLVLGTLTMWTLFGVVHVLAKIVGQLQAFPRQTQRAIGRCFAFEMAML